MSTKFIRNTLASLFRNLYNQKGQSICTIVVFGSFEQTESGSVVTVDLGRQDQRHRWWFTGVVLLALDCTSHGHARLGNLAVFLHVL